MKCGIGVMAAVLLACGVWGAERTHVRTIEGPVLVAEEGFLWTATSASRTGGHRARSSDRPHVRRLPAGIRKRQNFRSIRTNQAGCKDRNRLLGIQFGQ